jgi:hypothetical protein
MTANYERPDSSAQSASQYKANIDAMAKVFERIAATFAPHQVVSGSPQPDMAVELDPGFIWNGVTLTEVAAQTVSGFTIPSAGEHRIDRVVVDTSTGAASRVAGNAVIGSPSATPPDIPAGKTPVCQVLITDSDTVITDSMITDERVFLL